MVLKASKPPAIFCKSFFKFAPPSPSIICINLSEPAKAVKKPARPIPTAANPFIVLPGNKTPAAKTVPRAIKALVLNELKPSDKFINKFFIPSPASPFANFCIKASAPPKPKKKAPNPTPAGPKAAKSFTAPIVIPPAIKPSDPKNPRFLNEPRPLSKPPPDF